MFIQQDKRPTDYEYAYLSNLVYKEDNRVRQQINIAVSSTNTQRWRIKKIISGEKDYRGIIFKNSSTNHYVVAHKGTNSFLSLVEDIYVFLNQVSSQKREAFDITKEVIELAREDSATVSFTGHSLGAYLAELSLFYCYKNFSPSDEEEWDIREFANAVTFESPGTFDMIDRMQSNISNQLIDCKTLDITTYLSYPNLVNTCNRHVGTVYNINPDVGKWANFRGWHLIKVHSMQGILNLFEKNDQKKCLERRYMLDWPVGNQRDEFFNKVKLENGKYILSGDEQKILNDVNLNLDGHFTIDNRLNSHLIMPLKHFHYELQNWLKRFYKKFIHLSKNEEYLKSLIEQWSLMEVSSEYYNLLTQSVLKTNTNRTSELYLEHRTIEGDEVKLDAYDVRRKLSIFFFDNPGSSDIILKAFDEVDTKLVNHGNHDISASLFDSGARLSSTGEITNSVVSGVDTYIPNDTTPEMLEYFKNVSEHLLSTLKDKNIRVHASAAAPGSLIEGKISGLEVQGVKFTVGSEKPISANNDSRIQEIEIKGKPIDSSNKKSVALMLSEKFSQSKVNEEKNKLEKNIPSSEKKCM